MKRRTFLLSAATVGSFGLLGYQASRHPNHLLVRVWFSESAATYEDLKPRVRGYITASFEPIFEGVTVSFGGTVDTTTEDAYGLFVSGEWPTTLLSKLVDSRDTAPVSGVNLLVTDGNMRESPTGAGIPHVAAVGGAELIAAMPPADQTPAVVPFSAPALATQVMLHECGHAIGLEHDHGTMTDQEDGLMVSPMVSGYAWASTDVRDEQFDYDRSACGKSYVGVDVRRRRLLGLRFSKCANRELRLRLGFTPWE